MSTTTRSLHFTAAELSALESATLHSHLAGSSDSAALGALLDKLVPGNATMQMLRRTAQRQTREILAPHLAQIDAAVARRTGDAS